MSLANIFQQNAGKNIFQSGGNNYLRQTTTTDGPGQWDSSAGNAGAYVPQTQDEFWEYNVSPEQGDAIRKNKDAFNGIGYKAYDSQGNFLRDDKFTGVDTDKWYDKFLPLLPVLGWAGGTALMGGFGSQAAAAAGGAGASGSLPAPILESVLASEAAGAGTAAAGAGTAAATAAGGSGLASTLTSTLGRGAAAILPALLNGGGSSNGGSNPGGGQFTIGGNSNGGGNILGDLLNNILPIGLGINEKNKKEDGSEEMKNWLNTRETQMNNYMNPDSPEYKAMWDQMSRKDAAAGRNSQYGPRTSDFLSNVAKAKADNTRMFTTGNSKAYSDAINMDTFANSGLAAALGNMTNGSGGNSLGNILNRSVTGNQGGLNANHLKALLEGGQLPASVYSDLIDEFPGNRAPAYNSDDFPTEDAVIDYIGREQDAVNTANEDMNNSFWDNWFRN